MEEHRKSLKKREQDKAGICFVLAEEAVPLMEIVVYLFNVIIVY